MIALGTDSGPILAPSWDLNSDQIGPKRVPKSIKKVIEKFVELGIEFWPFWAKMEVGFRAGEVSKISKIRALGSKCHPSLQDGLPSTENTQKS